MHNKTIAVVRGIGIILVVLGHDHDLAPSNSGLINGIYAFHMPLFFLLSGIFLDKTRSFSHEVLRRADALLKPYFVVALTIMLGETILLHEVGLLAFLGKIIWGTGGFIIAAGHHEGWVPLWFLPHLFLVTLVVQALIRLMSSVRALQVSVVLLLSGLGIFIIRLLEGSGGWMEIVVGGRTVGLNGLPFSADLLPLTAAFMLLGYIFSEEWRGFKPSLGLTMLAAGVFFLLQQHYGLSMNLTDRRYDDALICTVQAASGIYITFALAFFFTNSALGDVLSKIGDASLIILMFHFIVLESVHTWIPSISVYKSIELALLVATIMLLTGLYQSLRASLPWLERLLLPVYGRR